MIGAPLRQRVGASCVSCTVSIVIAHTLPSMHSNLGPMRHHVLCTVGRTKVLPGGTCGGSTHVINSILNGCRPRNSATICSSTIHVTRSFSVHCPLMSNRNGFNSVSNSSTTTVHCARVHVTGVALRVLHSVSGSAISFVPGCSNSLARPLILPSHVPGLLIGNSCNVTMNVTAGIPPRGLTRIISKLYTVVSGPRVAVSRLVGCVGKPSFPATTVVRKRGNVRSACHANHNSVAIHTEMSVRRVRHKGGHVVIARLPCRIGGTHLIRVVTSLSHRGIVSNVATLHSRSSQDNVHVIVRLHSSIGPRVVLGGLCGRARVRIGFNSVVLTLISKRPHVLGLGRVLCCCLGRRRRIVAEEDHCRLRGTRTGTRVLRNLLVTLSRVSRIVHAVHRSQASRITGATLVSGFNLSRGRTITVLSVHLHHLANLRESGVRTSCGSIRRAVTCLHSLLSDERGVVKMIGTRLASRGGGFKSGHHARVTTTLNSVSIASLVPSGPVAVALAGRGCVGHVSSSSLHARGGNNHNMDKLGVGSKSCIHGVLAASARSQVLFFAGGNGICVGATCSVPRSDHATEKDTVVGFVASLNTSRRIARLLSLSVSRRKAGCLLVIAGCNCVGGATLRRCGGVGGGNLVTVHLGSRSHLMTILPIGNGRRVVVKAEGNVTVHFSVSSSGMQPLDHSTSNIRNVHLGRKSSIMNMIITTRGSVFAVSTSKGTGEGTTSTCHLRNEGKRKAVGFGGNCRMITLITTSSESRLINVSRRKVAVHVPTSRVSDGGTGKKRNIVLRHLRRKSQVTSVSIISRPRRSRRGSWLGWGK